MQHDGEKKRIQGDAGQQERPCGERREERRGKQSLKDQTLKMDRGRMEGGAHSSCSWAV